MIEKLNEVFCVILGQKKRRSLTNRVEFIILGNS